MKNLISQNEILDLVKKAYESDSCYFEGELNGEPFKIRMNKNHARNGSFNDNQSIHNLSLINTSCPSGVGTKRIGSAIQTQVDKINDWSDAEEAILEFFYEIEKGY